VKRERNHRSLVREAVEALGQNHSLLGRKAPIIRRLAEDGSLAARKSPSRFGQADAILFHPDEPEGNQGSLFWRSIDASEKVAPKASQ